ncbi:MAG: hypothetical protein AAFQ98_00430 [Bacteroidota bacterium]
MLRIIRFLQSESFIFMTLVFVLAGQVIHTMYLFESVRPIDLAFSWDGEEITTFNWVHALLFSIAIEAAILMFILNGKSMPAKIYALASFATNVLYYAPWEQNIPNIITTCLISAMLAGSIWFFSDLFAEKVLPYQEEIMKTKWLAQSINSRKNGQGEKSATGFKTTLPEGRAS